MLRAAASLMSCAVIKISSDNCAEIEPSTRYTAVLRTWRRAAAGFSLVYEAGTQLERTCRFTAEMRDSRRSHYDALTHRDASSSG